MRISASTVAAHRFGVVRRRGYDPAEVDAAMERVADTLREYEELAQRFEQQQVHPHDESIEAIRRTFEAAERAKDEMIAEATAEAERVRRSAAVQADALTKAAREDSARIKADAEAEAAELAGRAAQLLDIAERQAEERLLDAENAAASAAIAKERITTDLDDQLRSHLEGARIQAAAMLAEARDEVERVLAAAQEDQEQLSRTLVALELAVTDTRRQLRGLGDAALAASVAAPAEDLAFDADHAAPATIDLTDRERESAKAAEDERDDMVVELAAHRESFFAAPDGSGALPADRPVMDPDEVRSRQEGTSTFYQRRAAGLRARIERQQQPSD